jgi:hypothetical protein
MSQEFQREDRYIVIKRKDLDTVFRSDVREQFYTALHRRNCHDVLIPQRKFLVIESDWPEYEPVWRMIEARMTGALVSPAGGEVEVLAVVTLGGYFSSEELGDIDIEPRMAVLEQIQQEVVMTDADEHLELVDRANLTRLQAENAALQQRLNVADQRADDLVSDIAAARELLKHGSSPTPAHCESVLDFLAGQSAPAAKPHE